MSHIYKQSEYTYSHVQPPQAWTKCFITGSGNSLVLTWDHFLSLALSKLVFCLLWVSSDCAQPITGQVTEVTCPVIGRAQPELTPSKRLCSANHWPGYWSNLPCDRPSTAWAYSEQETENRPRHHTIAWRKADASNRPQWVKSALFQLCLVLSECWNASTNCMLVPHISISAIDHSHISS